MEGQGVLILITALIVYLLPGAVANLRAHHQQGAIWTLNILAGWTVIGWIGAMVWAMTAVRAR